MQNKIVQLVVEGLFIGVCTYAANRAAKWVFDAVGSRIARR